VGEETYHHTYAGTPTPQQFHPLQLHSLPAYPPGQHRLIQEQPNFSYYQVCCFFVL